MKITIVGAGLYGAVCAHELTKAGYECRIIDKRDHIGGNVYTRYDEGARCHEHVYGAHIFHTNSDKIWDYVNQFAAFNNFTNRVKSRVENKLYSLPINLMTLHQVFGIQSPDEAIDLMRRERLPIKNPRNLEEFCLSEIGPTLYNMFIAGYTEKQWGRHPKNLSVDIIKRLPIRLNFDDNYFNDKYQGIPIGGYTKLVANIIGRVPVDLGVDFLTNRSKWESSSDCIIYTGTIDSYFRYDMGHLAYRSLRFERERINTQDFQGNAVINYPDRSVPFTRIIEHKHFDQDLSGLSTIITKEYPAEWEPGMAEYYPVNDRVNMQIFRKYRARAERLGNVHFGGRLGHYMYYDMHQVIGSALANCNKFISERS